MDESLTATFGMIVSAACEREQAGCENGPSRGPDSRNSTGRESRAGGTRKWRYVVALRQADVQTTFVESAGAERSNDAAHCAVA